jgi:two-component sensor histidine kinase
LVVRDNGIGFPDELDFRSSDTLGMLLISTLVKQLRGVIDLERKGGTTFTIKFKKLKQKERR